MNNRTHLNMILSSVPFDNIVDKIIAESLWLWHVATLLPLELHQTKEVHSLFTKIFHLPLTKTHTKNLLLVIQHNNNPGFFPFHILAINIVNHI